MSIPLRVLLVEDSEDDALILERELKRGGYEPIYQRVQTEKDMAAKLKEQEWDIVISDYLMPKFNGLEAFKLVKESGMDLPFIIISGKIGEDTAVGAMRAGVHDYIMKDKLARLIPAIQRELREAEVRKERRLTEEELKESERRFTLFMRHLPGLAFIKDEHGKILYINEFAEKIYGWKIKEVLGKTDSELWPQDIASRIRVGDKQALVKRKVVESIDSIERDGNTVTYLSYRFPIIRKGFPTWLGTVSIDITKRQQAEDLLKQTADQLQIEREALEKKNIALREILNQIEAEKNIIKQQIVTNVEQAIIPTLLRMKETSHPTQARNFDIMEKELREIVSPFLETIKNKFAKLSPRELEVCRLIKNGMTSKEIAEALKVSLLTVHKYRELIRRKLDLVNDDTNLQTFLQSL
jgi:PAS domain S-box-containing protein